MARAATIDEQRRQQALKRLLDIVVGTLVVLVVVPIVVILAIAVSVRLRTWPFFVHERLGRHGQIIRFPKLRTLPRTTPPYVLKSEFAIAPAGRFLTFLRERHLDELPQLFLVPFGRLSMVGPRPKMPDRYEPAPKGYRDARVLVPQGCTGLWQIGTHTSRVVHECPDYDFAYLQYGSIRMDLWILWCTVVQFVRGRGFELDSIPAWVVGKGFVSPEQLGLVGAEEFLVTPALAARRSSGQRLVAGED